MSITKIVDLRDKEPRFRTERLSFFRRGSEKSTPLKVRKRRARFMAATICVLATALTAAGITLLSHHPSFVISSIVVQGTREIPAQAIREYISKQIDDSSWKYLSQRNIFTFDRMGIEEELAHDLPKIKSVTLSRPSRLSQSLVVSIQERRAAALWCSKVGACYQMDDSGFIFDQASSVTLTSYSFDGGISASSSPIGQTFGEGHMSDILAILERLRKLGYTAGGVSIDSKSDFVAHLIRGYDLKVAFGKEPGALVRDLQLVLSSEALRGKESALAYVDLRFGNRVYFKFDGEVAGTSTQ